MAACAPLGGVAICSTSGTVLLYERLFAELTRRGYVDAGFTAERIKRV